MIDNSTMINVYNEYDGNVYGISQYNDYGYTFEKANEFGEPSITPVPFSDVSLINNKSQVFRNGTLRFDTEMEEEIYQKLKITPSKNYLTKSDIEDIIANTTTEKLQKIIDITSPHTLDKVRAILLKLNAKGEIDIAKRVFDVVEAREYELSHNILRSDIKLVEKKNTTITIKTDENKESIKDSTNDEKKTQKKTSAKKDKE